MKPIVTKLAIVLLLGVAAMAQSSAGKSDSDATVCTDLSGKIPLPCPGQENTAPARPAKVSAPAPVPDSDLQGVSVPAAQASQHDASTATGPRSASGAAPLPAKVVPTRAQPQPSASSSASAAVALTQGCTDLSGRHAAPCPAKMHAVVAADVARGPDGGPAAAATGVTSSAAVEPERRPQPVGASSPERALLRNLFADQKAIWGSPLRLRFDSAQWLVPLLGGAAVVVASDTDIQNHVPTSPSFRRNSNNFSNYGAAAFAGVTGATWMLGLATHNDKMRETGVLSGEAALDSFALTYAIKSITQRDRPYQGNGHGNFWSKGNSFPSEHAAAAWSVATVFAHAYPGPLTKLLAYGGAAAVSAARVTADKHFASDALVGSALGYFIGRQVYRAHHDQGLGDAAYGTFERTRGSEGPRDPANMGSTYVALDSWVYDAMDRLAALGYINSAFAGLRPWTRLECARLLQEAESHLQSYTGGGAASAEAVRLSQALRSEFLAESGRLGGDRNLSVELESVYTRFTGISGKPLNDSYHFGQTIINDYGRPYQEGFNMVTGFTSHAEAGPLAFYIRGEYQHSPSAPAYSLAIRRAIAVADGNPVQPAIPFAAHDDFQLLDTYAVLNIKGNQISFGRQSTWWGPGQGGALMFSSNALPFYMLRWTRVSPQKLPSFLGILGPMRTDIFIGRLEGHHFPGNPYISGQKVSFKPTENLELGFSKMSVFAGGGTPLTWHNYYKATFSVNDHGQNSDLPGNDPGDRRGGFDFTYRVPGLRKWLTLYSDSLVDDDPSPLAAPRRAAFNPGIYLSHVPGLPHLDFRAESAYTDLVAGGSAHGNFIYWNGQFRDSHTNNGNIMGSWVGRQGRGIQVSSTYWFSPQNTINFSYRNGHVARDFLEGGDLNDISGRASVQIGPQTTVTGLVQYEWWNFPLLSSAQQRNVSASIQIRYRPAWRH